ncbi:MAG: hypothetical protein JXD18_12105 [Anaerolineae bacterium]|nr:hypothetical protein [Anaerolineae bacterium]
MLDHPLVRLELRRARRKVWWPKGRFSALVVGGLGAAPIVIALMTLAATFGCVVLLIITDTAQADQIASAFLVVVSGIASLGCLFGALRALVEVGVVWIAPAVAAISIARERELGTFDILRTTLLSERSIVLGKWAGTLIWLWPGILLLLVLTPLQVIWVITNNAINPLTLFALGGSQNEIAHNAWLWGGFLLIGIAGMVKPWADIALHTTTGLFVSTLCKSSGAAVAVTYGALIVMRGLLWITFSSIRAALLTIGVLELTAMSIASIIGEAWIACAQVLLEVAGAAILVLATAEMLRRE